MTHLPFKFQNFDTIDFCKLMFTGANSARTEKELTDCLEYFSFIELSEYPES